MIDVKGINSQQNNTYNKINKAIYFSGGESSLANLIGDKVNLGKNFTIEFLIQPNEIDKNDLNNNKKLILSYITEQSISSKNNLILTISKKGGYNPYLTTLNVDFDKYSGSLVDSKQLNCNVLISSKRLSQSIWTYISIVRDNNKLILYCDNKKMETEISNMFLDYSEEKNRDNFLFIKGYEDYLDYLKISKVARDGTKYLSPSFDTDTVALFRFDGDYFGEPKDIVLESNNYLEHTFIKSNN